MNQTKKLRSYKEIKELIKQERVKSLGCSDDVEIHHFAVESGAMTSHISLWSYDFDREFVVVDNGDKPIITKSQYERLKILFED